MAKIDFQETAIDFQPSGVAAFPTLDPNKPIDFIEDIIPPTGIPGIADPKDVSAPVFKPTAAPTKLKKVRPWIEEFDAALARGTARVGAGGLTGAAAFVRQPPSPGAARALGLGGAFSETPTEATKRLQVAKKLRGQSDLLWKVSQNPALAAQNKDLASKALNLIGETVPYITATTAGFIAAGPAGAFAVGSLVEGNSSYRTAREHFLTLNNGNPLTPEQETKSQQIGIGVGIVSGAVEAFGGKYAEQLAMKSIAKLKSKVLKGGAVFGIGTIVEALEEGAQEVAAITGEETYRDVNWNERTTRTLGSMAGGAFLGGAMRGGSMAARGTLATVQPATKVTPQKRTQAIDFVKSVLSQEKYAALDEKTKIEIGQRMLAEQGVEVEADELAGTPSTEPVAFRREPPPVIDFAEAEAPPTEAIPAPEPTPTVQKPSEVAEVPPKAVEEFVATNLGIEVKTEPTDPKNKYEVALGQMSTFIDKDNKLEVWIKETPEQFVLSQIKVEKEKTGLATKFISQMKAYSDKTGKKFIIPAPTPIAKKFLDKFDWLEVGALREGGITETTLEYQPTPKPGAGKISPQRLQQEARKQPKPEAAEAKPDDIVKPKLHIGNITARMRNVAAEAFGVEPEDVGPFLEGAFPTKKAEIPMSRTEAEDALAFTEQSLDERLEKNQIRTESDLTQANIDWADIKALRIALGKPVGARPFTVARAEKPQVAIIDTEKGLADQTVLALKEIAEALELDTKGTKAELVSRIEVEAASLETPAETIIRLAKEEVSKRAVTVLKTTKDVIQAAIKPSSIMDAGLSADKVLQVVMKKAEVVSAKAWLESARDIVKAHKDLATYIKGRMKGIGLSTAEQNRLLQMVAKGRTPSEKVKIAAAVEMLAHRAEIRQANKNLEKVIKKFKKKVGKTVWKGGLWPNAQQKIENLLSAITTKKITEKTLNDARSLRNYLERAKEQIENKFDADLAESLIPSSRLKLLDTVTRDQTRLLTPQGIEAITQEIERVINLNDVKSKWFIFGKINRAKTLLKNIEGEVREGKTRRSAEKEIDKYEVKRGIFKRAADIGIGLNNDDLYTLAKRIIGKEGYLEDVVDTNIRKGTDKVYEVLQTALQLFDKKIAAAGVTAKDLKRMSSEFDTWTPSAFFKKLLTPTSTVTIKGKKIKLTQGQLIDIYLYDQQKQSRDYMLNNPQNYFNNINVGKLTAQELSDVLSKLSPKAKIVADAMSDVLNTYVKGELADTQLKLDGINIFTIPNHWHIEHPREGRISGHQAYVSEKIELQDFMRPRVGSRTGIVNRDAFVRFRKVLAGSAEYIGYAEPLRTLRMVLNNTNVTDAIKEQGYRAELNAMKTIVKRAQETSPLIDDLSSLSSRMLRGFIRSALALKVDIGAMQATSAALYLNFIEAKYLTPLTVRGFFTRSELKEAIEHSPFLWARWTLGHQSMEVGYLAQTDATLRLFMGKSHKANWTMKHLQIGDMVAMLNGWRIAKKYVKNTTTHKVGSQEYWDAVNKKANYLWYRTQPIFDKFGRSVNTSTPGLARHAFIFRSFRQKALQNIHNGGKFNNKTRAIAIVLLTLAMGELVKAMIRWPLFGDKPEPKELAKKLTTSPLSLLAVVGFPAQSIVSNMIDRALGDTPRWSEVELSLPIFGMINKSLQSLNHYSQAIGFQISGNSEKAEEHGLRALRNMIEALATYFGAPVSFFRAFTKKRLATKKTTTKKPVFKRRGTSTKGRKTVFKKRTR